MPFTGEGAQDLHPLFRVLQIVPAELAVEFVRVACGESPAAQALQVGVTHHGFDQPLAETVRAIFFVNKNIAEIRKDGVIADFDSAELMLRSFIQKVKKGVFNPRIAIGIPSGVTGCASDHFVSFISNRIGGLVSLIDRNN